MNQIDDVCSAKHDFDELVAKFKKHEPDLSRRILLLLKYHGAPMPIRDIESVLDEPHFNVLNVIYKLLESNLVRFTPKRYIELIQQ